MLPGSRRWSALVLGVLLAACGGDPGERKAPQKPPDAGADVELPKPDAAKPDANQPDVEEDTGVQPPEPDAADAADAAPDVADAGDAADATPDAADADADVPPMCSENQDCDDGAFCNGAERCANGICLPGTPPVLSDGVDCTVDTCNEAADRVEHQTSDTACNTLDSGPSCATAGQNAGKLVRTDGVCNAQTGCQAITTLVDDCLDDTRYPTSFSCAASGAARILRHDGACIAATARCGTVDTPVTDCSTAIPSPHPYCSGTAAASNLTHHFNAQATCGGGSDPSCGFTESTASCTPGSPECAFGQLRTFSATCSAGTGCGRNVSSTSSCADSPDTCTSGANGSRIFTTFTPACASATACGSATPTATTCTAPGSTCSSATLTTRTPTCTLPGGCGVATSTSACPDAPDTCSSLAGTPVFTSFTPACADGTSCAAAVPTATTCTAPGPTCTNATLTTRTPTCGLPGGCGVSTSTSACADSPDTCSGPTGAPVFTRFTPACADGTSCGPAQPTATACTAPGPTCTNATLTTRTPTCALPGGCAVSTSTSACPDSPDTCSGPTGAPVFTRFTPACADGTSCGPAQGTPTACTAPGPTCTNATLTTRTPTCALPGGCAVSTSTSACPDSPDTCTTVQGSPVFTRFAPVCASGTACGPAQGTPTACTAPGPTCTNATLTTRTPTCALPGGCGVTTATSACTAGSPICVPATRVPTRRTFTAACDTAGAGCQSPGVPTDTACPTQATTCTGGNLTTHAATCTGAGVCGDTPSTTSCPDSPTTCTGGATAPLTLTTFTPTCSSGSACGTPVATQTTCATPPPTCNGLLHSTFTATCDATKETCGATAATQDCTLNATRCDPTVGVPPSLQTLTGFCDPSKGCQARVTGSRQCNQSRCLNVTTLEVESGACPAGATACSSRIVTCQNGCSAGPPAQCK